MTGQDLKNSILQLAIQGKLVEQREEEGTAKELIEEVKAEKERLIKEKKIRKEKPLPKISEEEIPYDIPESWEWVRLGEIGFWKAGSTPSRSNPEYYNGNIPWLKTGDLNDGFIDEVPEFITEKALKETSVQLNPVGSVLMAMYGATIGKLGILNIEATTNQACCACIPFTGIYNKYLFYYLFGQRKMFLKMGAGGAQPNISRTKIINSVFPLPPLDEQKRIVKKIEELIPYIDKYGETHIKLEELNKNFPTDMQKSILQYAIQGRLVEQREEEGSAEELYKEIQKEKEKLTKEGKIRRTKALAEVSEDEIPFDIPENWKWVRLGDIFNVNMGQSPKGSSVSENKDGVEFHQGKVFFGEDYIQESNLFTKNPTKIAEPGTVVLCVRAPVGIVNITERNICIGRGLCGINTFSGMDPKFVMYILRGFENAFIKKASGTTFIAITSKVVNDQPFPLPPLEEQKRIVSKIEELLPLCSQLKQSVCKV